MFPLFISARSCQIWIRLQEVEGLAGPKPNTIELIGFENSVIIVDSRMHPHILISLLERQLKGGGAVIRHSPWRDSAQMLGAAILSALIHSS